MLAELNSTYVDASPADAIQKGHFQQVRYLLELGHAADAQKDGHTGLQLCSLVDDLVWRINIAQILLQKGAHVGQHDSNGLNALHYACLYERAELVNIFLHALDYDLNAGDRHGNTALFYAASGKNIEIVRDLVQVMLRYHLTLNKANRMGMTPLMQAWSKDKISIAELLQSNGADTTLKDIFNKSTYLYESEARSRDHNRKQMEAKKRRCIRFNDVAIWQEQQTRQRESQPQILGWFEKLNEMQRKAVVHPRDMKRLIFSAQRDDMRNDPRIVFNATPAQFFESKKKSFQIADQTHGAIESGYCPISAQRVKNAVQQSKSANPINWRHNMARMYHDLQYQVSPSYLPTAKRNVTVEQSAIVGCFDENFNFLRMGELLASADEEAGDGLSNMQHFSRNSSHGNSHSKISKDTIFNRKDRRIKKNNFPSTGKSSFPECVSKNDDGMTTLIFNFADVGSRSKKRILSGMKSRPISRAAFNTHSNRDTPSPKRE